MEQIQDCNNWPVLVMYRDGEPSGTATKELGLLVIHLASDRTESHNFAYELGIQVSIGI